MANDPMSQPTDRPAPCRHQYWDFGRCIDCFKTANKIDDERRQSDPTNDPRNWGTPEELSGMEDRRRAPAQPETSAPPAPEWNEQYEMRLAQLVIHMDGHNYSLNCEHCPADARCRPVCENRLAIVAALQHIEGLTRQLEGMKQSRDEWRDASGDAQDEAIRLRAALTKVEK